MEQNFMEIEIEWPMYYVCKGTAEKKDHISYNMEEKESISLRIISFKFHARKSEI